MRHPSLQSSSFQSSSSQSLALLRRPPIVLLVGLLCALCALPAAAQDVTLTVLPAEPTSSQAIRVLAVGELDDVSSVTAAGVELDGGTLNLLLETTPDIFGASPPVEFEAIFDIDPLGFGGMIDIDLLAVDAESQERRLITTTTIDVIDDGGGIDIEVEVEVVEPIDSNTAPVEFSVSGVASCVSTGDPVVGDGLVVVVLEFGCQITPPAPSPFRFDYEIAGGLDSGEWIFEAVDPTGRVLGRAVAQVLQDPPILQNGRFLVDVSWRDFDGNTGVGTPAVPSTVDSTLLWFFGPTNWEMLVKVLDGCSVNDHYWVIGSASTNVEYDLEIVDLETSATWTLSNPLGELSPAFADVEAFPCD